MTELEVRLESLSDDPRGAPAVPLPAELQAAYGGPFLLPADVVYRNFVTSIDGVAAIEGVKTSSATISGGEPADRFVMAVLRGGGGCRRRGVGDAEGARRPVDRREGVPPGADAFRRLRSELSVGEAPTLVVVTASGGLPADHPAVAGAVVVTTSSGAREVADRGVRCAEVIDVGEADEVDGGTAIARLRERGHRRILTEGGPSLMGSMLAAGVVEQLFLTISPKLLGGGEGRPPLTGETDLLETALGGTLLGVRRAGDYLFLRYGLAGGAAGSIAPEPADPRGPRGVEIGAGREATVEPRIVMPCANAQAARARSGSPPAAITTGSAAHASSPSGNRSLGSSPSVRSRYRCGCASAHAR